MPYVPAGFFVLRMPLLPAEALLELSDGLEAAGQRAGDDAGLAAAIARDRARLDRRLEALCDRADVREALFVASPALEARLDGWRRAPPGRRGRKLEHALLRYLTRMAARPTPFGLCAGYCVGTVDATPGARTSLRLQTAADVPAPPAPRLPSARRLRRDGARRDPAVRDRLTYVANSSAYATATQLRYVELRRAGATRTRHLVAIDRSPGLDAVLDRASAGAGRRRTGGGGSCAAGVPLAEARAFVDELIAAQVIVADAGPAVTTPAWPAEPLEHLRARLGLAGAATDAPPGAGLEDHRRLASAVAAVGGLDGSVPPLHVELVRPAAAATLGGAVLAEIAAGVELLHRIGGAPHVDPLADFRAAFRERYGRREDVGCCAVLDRGHGHRLPRRRRRPRRSSAAAVGAAVRRHARAPARPASRPATPCCCIGSRTATHLRSS